MTWSATRESLISGRKAIKEAAEEKEVRMHSATWPRMRDSSASGREMASKAH